MATPATKDKSKPDAFPVMVQGDIHFVKRSEYAKRTAEDKSIQFKAEIKKDDITTMLEKLDKGINELDPESPEEYTKTFDTVKEDYAAAVAKVKEESDKAAVKAQEEKDKDQKKKDEDAALVLVGKDAKPEIDSINSLFDTGSMDRCIPKVDVTDEQLLTAFNTGLGMSEFSGWMIGDLGAELVKRGRENVISELAEARGRKYSGIAACIKTAKSIPPESRVQGVSFTIYREIATAKFTKEQEEGKKAVLALAMDGKLTTQSAREEVKKAQGKTAPEAVAPENNDKFSFLVVDPNAELASLVTQCVGFPKELFENGAIVINPKNMKSFQGWKMKGQNRWSDVGEYKSPDAPKAEEAKPAAKKAAKKK